MTTISEKITNLRKNANLTQEALGAKLGITGQAVSKWEKGDSMPDILILSKLCRELGCTLEYLLGETDYLTIGDPVTDFCTYAKENGRIPALLDALSRIDAPEKKHDGGAVHQYGNQLHVYVKDAFGFIGCDCRERTFAQKPEDIAYFLRILTDEACLKVLFCMEHDKAVTAQELMEKTGLEEDAVDRILLGMMKRNILCCGTDDGGKRGYMQTACMAGVDMILAGCYTAACGGEHDDTPGGWWFKYVID